ncbi:hypothetical protein AALO_G00118960 [Alosa alosa]|uniref:Uncharacterized protein n=1 Tax=Alosa alosa TaxID=278164 RepID=A0AAV6GX87_9TELE|nr:hypothetical protein AALO_G00118960 [Alosa alosa]
MAAPDHSAPDPYAYCKEKVATAQANETYAGAEACLGVAAAGLGGTPLQVHAKGPGANAEAGASKEYTGASAGAHAGEVRAGPFAARAGVKFGAGIRNGDPEVDLGPVTTPCCIM